MTTKTAETFLDDLYSTLSASDPLRDLEPVESNNHPHLTIFIIGAKVFLHKAVNTDLCAAIFSVALGFLISTPSKEIKQVWSYSLLLFWSFLLYIYASYRNDDRD
jgi:hypothetical protein